MRSVLMTLTSLGLSLFGGQSHADDPPKPRAKPSAKSEKPIPPHKAADGDAPLAAGWPGGTEPGKIEIKRYPAYRSAVAQAKGASQSADNVLFWPLFNHISRKGVIMTAPVVNTYSNSKMLENPKAQGEMSMEFVYPSTKVGETGQGVGAVQVVDHPAATFVCLGVQGGMTPAFMSEGQAKLQIWLEEHKTEWVANGLPRRLGYHGPMTPVARRLWEVQIPVVPVKAK